MSPSSAAELVLKCFALLLSVSFLQDYSIDFQKARIADKFLLGDFEFSYIQLNSATLPSAFSVDYNTSAIAVHLPDCATVSGQVGISLFGLVTIPTPADATICGDVVFTPTASIDACHVESYKPDVTRCTLKATLSVRGRDAVSVDLCDMFDELEADGTVTAAEPSFPVTRANATPTADVLLFRDLQRVLEWIETAVGIEVATVAFPDTTAVRVQLRTSEALDLQAPALPIRNVSTLLTGLTSADYEEIVASLLTTAVGSDVADQINTQRLVSQFRLVNGPLGFLLNLSTHIPANATIAWDLLFANLTCATTSATDGAALDCVFPSHGGLTVGNVDVAGFADFDSTVRDLVASLVSFVVTWVQQMLIDCSGDTEQCTLLNTTAPTVVYPSLAANATSVKNVELFTLAELAANALANSIGLAVTIDALSDTTERVSVQTQRAIPLAPLLSLLPGTISSDQAKAFLLSQLEALEPLSGASLSDVEAIVGSGFDRVWAQAMAVLADWAVRAPAVPAGVTVSLDVAFPSLACSTSLGFDCTFPATAGVVPLQLSLHNISDWEFIVAKYSPSLLDTLVTPAVDALLAMACTSASSSTDADTRCSVSGLVSTVSGIVSGLL